MYIYIKHGPSSSVTFERFIEFVSLNIRHASSCAFPRQLRINRCCFPFAAATIVFQMISMIKDWYSCSRDVKRDIGANTHRINF